jgi:hypothetical protein
MPPRSRVWSGRKRDCVYDPGGVVGKAGGGAGVLPGNGTGGGTTGGPAGTIGGGTEMFGARMAPWVPQTPP